MGGKYRYFDEDVKDANAGGNYGLWNWYISGVT
jgi:hypothetical protein